MKSEDLSQYDPARLKRVLDVTRKLASSYELDQLLEQVIDAGRQVLEADRGSVFLFDEGANELHTTVATGGQTIRFSADQGIAGECVKSRKVVNVPDCYADPRFNREIDRTTGYRTKCLITVPLIGTDDELVGVMQLLNAAKGGFDQADANIATVLASQAAVAIQRTKLLEERMVKLKMERDLALARHIQMQVLPERIPTCPGFDVAGHTRPAEQTGGDIFDVVSLHGSRNPAGSLLLMIADAAGHGIGPALTVTQARAMLRMGLRLNADITQIHEHVNRQICEDLHGEGFVTAFLGVLNPAEQRITYHSAGQGPVMTYRRASNSCEWREASTIPWGVLEDPPPHSSQFIDLEPGDMLVLLTDGFYETMSPQDRIYGRHPVESCIQDFCDCSASEIMIELFRQNDDYRGSLPQADDLTALIVKREVS